MNYSVTEALARVQGTLLPVLDIIDQRLDDAQVPSWSTQRGWTDFLFGLDTQKLERCEAEGLSEVAPALSGIPPSLAELARAVRELSTLPALETSTLVYVDEDFRGVAWRKRQQLQTLLGALPPLVAQARRIVDVGAGSGHFTRLSARHFARESLGLEQNPERVARAHSRAQSEARDGSHAPAQFAVIDAIREPLVLQADDLAIGLHACGELGDALVRAVAHSGAELALVSCCLQKISAPERRGLSRAAGSFTLRKDTLGLSNLTSQAVGVEASIEHTMRAREARYALRLLLIGRGLGIEPGAEMTGINRRRAHAGLADIAQRSLAQRGLSPASADELAARSHEAALHFHSVRRLSLPRNMLARAVELAVILDRAACLEESGYAVRVATLFERAVTPRNISLFASHDGRRLPPVRVVET